MRLSRMTTAGALALICLAGCATGDLKQRNALLTQENEDLRLQLGDRNTALADSDATLRERDAELARLRAQEGEMVQQPLGQITGFEEIPNVTAAYGAGEITVSVESDVLFASGKTSLKTTSRSSLGGVASVLNRSYDEYLIRIEGHTDSDPIRKSGFKSNYHLGFERAYAVREYLITQGIDSERISVAKVRLKRARATLRTSTPKIGARSAK